MAVITTTSKQPAARFWRSIQVQVGTAATLLLPARMGRVGFTVLCDELQDGSPVTLAIDGSSNVSLTPGQSGRIRDGDGVSVETSGPVYAVASVTATVSVFETWD